MNKIERLRAAQRVTKERIGSAIWEKTVVFQFLCSVFLCFYGFWHLRYSNEPLSFENNGILALLLGGFGISIWLPMMMISLVCRYCIFEKDLRECKSDAAKNMDASVQDGG